MMYSFVKNFYILRCVIMWRYYYSTLIFWTWLKHSIYMKSTCTHTYFVINYTVVRYFTYFLYNYIWFKILKLHFYIHIVYSLFSVWPTLPPYKCWIISVSNYTKDTFCEYHYVCLILLVVVLLLYSFMILHRFLI